MRSIDVANLFINRHGNTIRLTNLSLNKLVYFAQVESLRSDSAAPLFSDPIEAWDYGPVEPAVYHSFKHLGKSTITGVYPIEELDGESLRRAERIVDAVAEKYGCLTAFDLVTIAHREGGAWSNRYAPGQNAEIRVEDIVTSADFRTDYDLSKTLFAGIKSAEEKWPNTLRMLEDA